MPDITNPLADTELDPYHQAQYDQQKERADYWENKEEKQPEAVDNSEMEAQVKEEPQEDEFSDVGDVARGVAETALQPVLGVADFASDAIGLVPWLKPIDEWWDANSYRSTHPGHKLIRDASSVILPTLAGGGWIVGGTKAAVAARAITLPRFAHTLGSIAAYTGVDTTVAMISSHSKTDDNMAATLNNWLGWNIPWATRPGDDPDTRWKKNVMEAAGLAGGVELLGAAFLFGNKAKLFPRDAGAEAAINAKRAKLEVYDDPLTAAVEPRRVAREAAQDEEMLEALKADPTGKEYNAFVNDLGEDTAGKAVVNLEADPLQAKLHQAQIQNSVGTINGRAAPVASEAFQKKLLRAMSGNERARHLDELFDSISPDFDAVVTSTSHNVKITAEQMNNSVDNLTQALYGRDISFGEFQAIVDDLKVNSFNTELLDREGIIAASSVFTDVYQKMFDPNQLRASAMLTQQSADTVADTAAAIKLLGDNADTSRQYKIIFEKLNLLDTELKVNKYVSRKAGEYKKLKNSGNLEATVSWLRNTSKEFDTYVKKVRAVNTKLNDELLWIAKEHPNYYQPLKEAYYATNGDVDELNKLHKWTEKNIGLIKKGFIDNDPEVPSMIVKGLHGARVNSLLSGLSPLKASVTNSTLTALKPVAVFAGAVMQGQPAVFKRAMYTYGGITENIRRGFKVMQKEWNMARLNPEEAMMRGRADMRLAKMENMDALDSMADAWRADEEWGKVAMWNVAKGLTWWNKQQFVRFGTNALYAIDGMTNSFMASGMARARAYDELFDATKGTVDDIEFDKLQRRLYDQAFDDAGVLTDEAAKHSAREISLNLDNNITKKLDEFMDHVPAAKGLFLFPRTGANALELGWSFNPLSNLGPAMTKARRVLGAKTRQQKLAALAEHAIDAGQDADLAFQTLKSEYIGRQIMGSSVIMGVGLWALDGNLTGSGPQDAAERSRMMAMGWQPYSIKNPVNGEWRSYKGFEPFDTLMGLTADVVYQAERVDQAVTEDWFRKLSYSIGMNITNDTFVGGFEPLVGLISGDPSAWTRFFAQQTDMMIPYKGMRTVLNNAITPQLKDVENDYLAYLKNANKFLFSGNEELKDLLDIYTGEPIRYFEPLTAAANAVLPMFKQNGGLEPWRQWLLSTGWDGIQRIRTNKYTGLPLNTEDRHFINNWVAANGNLRGQIIKLMTEDDGFWVKKQKEYLKARGLKSQRDFNIKDTILFRELDRIHDRVFNGAWDALEAYNEQYTTIGREIKHRRHEMGRGDYEAAGKTQQRITELQRIRK